MKKTPVYLPQDLYHELAQRATKEGTTVEELVRFAIAQTFKGQPEPFMQSAPAPTTSPQPDAKPAVPKPKAKAPAAPKPKPRPARPARLALRPAVPPSPPARAPVGDELYIRRLPVDEGLYRLDAYLDAAFLAGHVSVRIVHGKGGGILKDAVWQRLKEHPLVRSYRLAELGDGDAGVTVVELLRR